MATELDTVVTQPDVTHQGITKFTFFVPHNASAVIDKTKVFVRYEVTTWNSSGSVVSKASREIPYANWPAGQKTNVKDLYAKITADAKSNGLIGAGTDEPLD